QMVQNAGSPSVTGTIQGITGALVMFFLGTNGFSGRVTGHDVEVLLTGTKPQMQGACTYNYQADLKGTLNGDVLTGKIDFTTSTNRSADCGTLENCHSVEDFNGTRPPSR